MFTQIGAAVAAFAIGRFGQAAPGHHGLGELMRENVAAWVAGAR